MCGVNCHKKCEKLMPNLCGINQKMLAEKLNEIRKMPSQKKGKTGMSNNTSTTSVSIVIYFQLCVINSSIYVSSVYMQTD